MKIKSLVLLLSLLLSSDLSGQVAGPFEVAPHISKDGSHLTLTVAYKVQSEKAYLYKSMIGVDVDDAVDLQLISTPDSKKKFDQFLDKEVEIYDHDMEYVYRVVGLDEKPLSISVRYQGCDDKLCYMPVSKEFVITAGLTDFVESTSADTSSSLDPETSSLANSFTVVGTAAGYLSAEVFLDFLDASETGKTVSRGRLRDILNRNGAWVLVLIVLLFGLGLNLTPCVLPMIPVNIAIIGAGAQSGSRMRGFALGATYGLGISLAYGALGLLFVLTGTRFGTLNADPVFNIAIGLIFLLLSLAMFGVFNLDFTKFQGRVGGDAGKGSSFATAFILGSIAALLAGACVAPVVISTLVFALDIYNKGNALGLFLPFLLGLGMALPWPFAGAGLSFLPKAGMWMEKVKYGFGAIIIVAALYYIGLGTKLAIDNSGQSRSKVIAAQSGGMNHGWVNSLEAGMKTAQEEDKLVFVDFWASWCKNCLKMEKTTFRDEEVMRRLDDYVKVKFNATDQKSPEVKAVLERYVRVGLPTYVILKHE